MHFTKAQRSTLLIAGLIPASLIIGKYLVPAATKYVSRNWQAFIVGLALIALVFCLYQIGYAIWFNVQIIKIVVRTIPKSIEDMRSIGVRTPLDFVYAMDQSTKYYPYPVFSRRDPGIRSLQNRRIFARTLDMFQEMFNRDPIGFESGDWDTIARLEISNKLKKDPMDISYQEFEARVSKSVVNYFRNKKHFAIVEIVK